MEQINRTVQCIKEGKLPLPEEVRQQILDAFDYDEEKGKEALKQNIPNKEAAIWPVLADEWLKGIFAIRK